jgi:hypothetical protein
MVGPISSQALRGAATAPIAPVRPVRNNRAPDLEAQAVLLKLAQRDREVRAHEQAHMAAAGPYARGGPTYTFQHGPDGRLYAVAGEVAIDTAPVPGDPEETLRKAQRVRAAALAPAEPSSQDRAVASAAARMASAAQAEIQQRRVESAYAGAERGSGLNVLG